MINWRIIARIFSLLLIFEGLFMILSGGVSMLFSERAGPLFWAGGITLVSGALVYTPMRKIEKVSGKKEGYLIIAGSWLICSLFGTLPYLFSVPALSVTDAVFESMAGFTTTAASIFRHPENLPHGLLFWRSLTQWTGGAGVIIISLYVIPVFKSVYIQLPAGEFAGQTTDKIHPKMRDAFMRLLIIYVILTLSEVVFLVAAGWTVFDAVCTSFSTISTGGFSISSSAPEVSATPVVRIIITFFMFMAGLNIVYIYYGIKREFDKVFKSVEFLFYLIICVGFSMLLAALLAGKPGFAPFEAVADGSFQAISIITTTGFYIRDSHAWGGGIIIILFILMFTGGTSGSTSGGIKTIRLLLATRNSRQELLRLLHPNAYIPVQLDGRVIPQSSIFNLLVFIMLYYLTVCASAVVLSVLGYDVVTSFSTAASVLANIGPGLSETGVFAGFRDMPATGKWFISGLMFLGRLELLTVLILFTRTFYRS